MVSASVSFYQRIWRYINFYSYFVFCREKGSDGRQKKIGEAHEKGKKGTNKKRAKDEEVNGQGGKKGGKGVPRAHAGSKNCSHACVSLCTTVVHNTTQNSSDDFLSYLPDNHHSSDDIYCRGKGRANQKVGI